MCTIRITLHIIINIFDNHFLLLLLLKVKNRNKVSHKLEKKIQD